VDNRVLLLMGLSFVLACTSSKEGGTRGAGGKQSAAGSESAGGAAHTGGTPTTGGTNDTTSTATISGGTIGMGGALGDGGDVGTGGRQGTGGTSGTGGDSRPTSGIGGSIGSGGKQSAGGATGAGGKLETGGNIGAGGKPGTGGSAGGGSDPSDGGPTTVGCDRVGLQGAVDAYLAALQAADTSKMPLSPSVKYYEVATSSAFSKTTAIDSGLWKTALPVKFSRSLLDVIQCETFTEVFITAGSHPYVLGTRLTVKDDKISEIFTLVTDSDDWNFDAAAYDTCSESEDWSTVPDASRSTREVCIAAGEAYFKIFSDKSTVVPWGNPCYRLEGGKGCTPQGDKASTTCNVGIPDNITFKSTTWVADDTLNACVGITLFASASPDSHLFRLVNGKIRYVHTITVMK
jgi:hypothetical protein